MLEKLLEIDLIVDAILSEKGLVLSAESIAEIKNTATNFINKYNANSKHVYTFYWAEYPMGAIHSKELRKIDSVWTIDQFDCDKTPSRTQIPHSDMNDDNILESFIKILLSENKYK